MNSHPERPRSPLGTPTRSTDSVSSLLRTDERTNSRRDHSRTDNTSLTDTCARVQDFDDLKKRTAERKPEPTRELRDPVEVVASHLESEPS